MTVFDILKSKNIDELAEWFDECATSDYEPWVHFWDENYCNKCDTIYKRGTEFGWCEIHGKCRYFQHLNDVPDNKQIIKLWLESEC